jgi:hypothetical protein
LSRIDQYFDIDRMMSENELILAYRDHINEETIQQLLSITELKLVQSVEEKKLRKRVFHILVECLQNVVNHSAQNESDREVPSILLLSKHENEFFIITGNRIENDQIERLTQKIEEINSWSHDDMRDIYSKKLDKSQYSAKGGAGLGLIDIYKRSGKKLKYQVEPINDEISFLSLHITVDNAA